MHSSWFNSLLAMAPLLAVLSLSGCGSSPSSPNSAPHAAVVVVVTPGTATVLRGQSQQFVAQVSGVSDQTVTWQATANVGTIDSTGLYTAPLDGDGFLVTLTAMSKASPDKIGNAIVTLPPVSLAIAPNAIDVVPGASHVFTATVVGLADTGVNWTVQGTDGGTINSAGLYTAPSATGVYTVIASSSADANYSTSAVALVTTTPSPFVPGGQLVQGREFHTAALLTDGKVLVAGGAQYAAYCLAGMDSAEIYDPVLGASALTSSMTDRRYAHTSTLLQDGTVLITGGFSFDHSLCLGDGIVNPLTSAEIYDPSTGLFTPTGNLCEARGAHTATLLSTGKVLIVGGGDTGGGEPPFAGNASPTAEVYDPSTGTFSPTGSMSTARIAPTATLLPDGRVLVAGGLATSGPPIATAEVYDPSGGTFTAAGTMTVARAGHTATLLPDGNVLLTGGFTDSTLVGTDTAEIYNPAKASFLATNKAMAEGRWAHTATLLPNGTVLIVGGETLVAEIYSPSESSFSAIGLTDADRRAHTATLLKTGNVIIIGGTGSLNTTELFQSK